MEVLLYTIELTFSFPVCAFFEGASRGRMHPERDLSRPVA